MKSNSINDVTDSVLDESVKCLYQLVLSSLSRSGRSFNVYHATSGTDPNERWGGGRHHTIDLSLKKKQLTIEKKYACDLGVLWCFLEISEWTVHLFG